LSHVLLLCLNPDWEHFYGILSGEPMAYYLYAIRNEPRQVFYSTRQHPQGNLPSGNNVKYGYIYNQGKIRWYFRLINMYESISNIPFNEKDSIPPFREGYTEHVCWYLITDLKRLSEEYSNRISRFRKSGTFHFLTGFTLLRNGKTKKLKTANLNAAICKTSFRAPHEKDFDESIVDPVRDIVKTDLRSSKLLERTVERAFVLRLLERGNYPVDGKYETIDWCAEQPVFEERSRYDLVFRLKESQRYVAVEFKRGNHEEELGAINQLSGYIEELKKDKRIGKDAVILPRIVCEHRSKEIVKNAKEVLGPMAEVEEYQLSLTFSHENLGV
jgi:hypothetical protein